MTSVNSVMLHQVGRVLAILRYRATSLGHPQHRTPHNLRLVRDPRVRGAEACITSVTVYPEQRVQHKLLSSLSDGVGAGGRVGRGSGDCAER